MKTHKTNRELVLEAALRGLYDETADYIRINHLGDVHHNQTMKNARDALGLRCANDECKSKPSATEKKPPVVWHGD